MAIDVNGDGHLDLISGSASQIALLTGNRNGGFAPPRYYLAGGEAVYGLASGDFNDDGRQDVVVLGESTDNAAILTSSGCLP